MISVVLMEIEHPGNVGAIARSMGNFGFVDLVLVNPKCDHFCQEARCRAKHAQEILENARVVDASVLDTFDYLIGTTARVGNDYNIKRSPITPNELASVLKGKDASFGLLIGREGNGLTNDEIKQCDYTVTIPASKEYATLNISHAVAILLYALHGLVGESHTDHFVVAGVDEKKHLFGAFDELLDSLPFETPEKKETQRMVWKKLVGKSMLTKREAFALFGLFKKMKEK